MAMIECSKCGKHVSDGSPYCPHCGEPVARKLAPFETDPKLRRLRRLRLARKSLFVLALVTVCYWFVAGLSGSMVLPRIVPPLAVLFLVGWAVTALAIERSDGK